MLGKRMGIDKFWLQPNNKKALDEFKGEIKQKDLSSKFDALFNIWDKDKSGKLESGEVISIFNQISNSESIENQEFLEELFCNVSKSNAENLAKRFQMISENHKSYRSIKEFQKMLDNDINADNILDILDAYDNPEIRKNDTSIIDTVVSEKLYSGDRQSQKKVLLTILEMVCVAAQKNGVAEADIAKARKDFQDSVREEYDTIASMFRMANPLKMERAIEFLRGAILVKQNEVEDVDSKDAMITVTEQFYNENETAYDEFNIERSATAKFGDWVCGLFGCKTIDEMKTKLDMNNVGANELLTALVNEDENGFKVAYKKLFGIDFDPQKVAAAQELGEKFAAVQMLSSNLHLFEEVKNSPNLEEALKEKFKYSDEIIAEIVENYPAATKSESLKLFIEESFNNAKDMILELSDGKTLEQLSNDVELATKSAYGDNDISKEITQFNQNMVMTEAIADSAFEIVGTIALTMIPVVGQLGAAALAARTAKMGSNMVKVTQMLRKTSVAMYKANKFQQGTKYTSKVKNYGTRVAATVGNTAVATAGVNALTQKDIKTIIQKTLMNSAFSWVGATSNTLSPILMKQFGISSQAATELAEEILNVAGSYGVTKANGADYTQADAFVDLATGLIFARIAGGSRKNAKVSDKAEAEIKQAVENFEKEPIFTKFKNKMKDFTIPYRFRSKYYDDLGGNHGTRRILLTLMDSGKSDDEIIREIFDVSNMSETELKEAYKSWQDFKHKINRIDRSFNEIIPNPIPMTYYRGITGDIETNRGLQIIRDAKVGDTIAPDVGYPMAALDKKTAQGYANTRGDVNPENNVFITIKAPIGTQVSRDYGIGGFDEASHAYVIFRRNAQYKVLKKEIIDNQTHITLEYIGGEKGHSIINNSLNYPLFILPKLKNAFKHEDIDETVNAFIKHYSESAPQIKQYLEDFGLSGLGNTRSRVKSYQSLHDKITNFLKDNPSATYEDVWKEVRDCFGARTIIDSADFKNHPSVKDLINKGDMDGAIRRAAELQSDPLVQEFRNIIDKNCSGDKRITTARISNYVSEGGIPYLSEAQLAEIKQYAASNGVKINIVEKIAKDDPHYKEIMEADYKPTTKSQPSGYTALQINFKTADGDVFEWQYRGKLVDNFAEGEHIPYDLRTGKNIIGEHEELRPLYEPLQKMLSKDNMPKEVYAQYNKYLTDYYTHLRKLELGFESTPPRLSDYEINGFKFDSRLEANNLVELHNIAEKIKNNMDFEAEDIKYFFIQNKIEKNFFTEKVKNIINEIPLEIRRDPNFNFVNHDLELNEDNYKIIAFLLNLENGSYRNEWLMQNNFTQNLQKLAIFAQVLDFTHQYEDFLTFDKNQWEVVMNGIVNNSEKYVEPLLKYKYNSKKINEYLDAQDKNSSVETIEYANLISEYLALSNKNKPIIVYRGEGGYGIMTSVSLSDEKLKMANSMLKEFKINLNRKEEHNLAVLLENFSKEINAKMHSDEDIKNFCSIFLDNVLVHQSRFLSTSMTKMAVEGHIEVISWESIDVPEETQGAFIESYCVERSKEAEFLIQRDSKLLIKKYDYKYNSKNQIVWLFQSDLIPGFIDTVVNKG